MSIITKYFLLLQSQFEVIINLVCSLLVICLFLMGNFLVVVN